MSFQGIPLVLTSTVDNKRRLVDEMEDTTRTVQKRPLLREGGNPKDAKRRRVIEKEDTAPTVQKRPLLREDGNPKDAKRRRLIEREDAPAPVVSVQQLRRRASVVLSVQQLRRRASVVRSVQQLRRRASVVLSVQQLRRRASVARSVQQLRRQHRGPVPMVLSKLMQVYELSAYYCSKKLKGTPATVAPQAFKHRRSASPTVAPVTAPTTTTLAADPVDFSVPASGDGGTAATTTVAPATMVAPTTTEPAMITAAPSTKVVCDAIELECEIHSAGSSCASPPTPVTTALGALGALGAEAAPLDFAQPAAFGEEETSSSSSSSDTPPASGQQHQAATAPRRSARLALLHPRRSARLARKARVNYRV